MLPNFNTAATEAAIMGYGVLFYHNGNVGLVWWDNDYTYCIRGLMWEDTNCLTFHPRAHN